MAGKAIELAIILSGKINQNLINAFNRAGTMGNRLNQNLKSQSSVFGGLSSGLGSVASGVVGLNQGLQLTMQLLNGMKSVTNVVDTYSSTSARLNMVNDGLQSSKELQDMIYQSAQRSRSEYNIMGASVAKLNLLAKDSFSSNREALAFTEMVQKSFTVAGASGQEMQAGMYQLTQAMGAGKLQGDEFKSITENAPLIADAISKYLKIPIGSLKELSSEGLITSDIIKNAMFAASDEINKKFKEMPVTFEQTMTILKNTALIKISPMLQRISDALNSKRGQQLVDSIISLINAGVDLAFYVVPKIIDALKFFQDNANTIIPIIEALIAGFAGFKIVVGIASTLAVIIPVLTNIFFAISAVVGGAATLGEAMLFLMGPVGWVALAIGALIAIGVLLYKNWDTVSIYLQNIWIWMKKEFFGLVDEFIADINLLIKAINLIPGVNVPLIAEFKYKEEYLPTKGDVSSYLSIGEQVKAQKDAVKAKKYGSGGFVNTPHYAIVGDVPETIVPHRNDPNSRALLANAASGVGMPLGTNINVYVTGDTNNPKKLGYDIAEAIEEAILQKRRVSFG